MQMTLFSNAYMEAFISGLSRAEIAARFGVTVTTVCSRLITKGRSPRRCSGCAGIFWLPAGDNPRKSWCSGCHDGSKFPGYRKWAAANPDIIRRNKKREGARAWLKAKGAPYLTLPHVYRSPKKRRKAGDYLYLVASDTGANWGIGVTHVPDKRVRDYNSHGDGIYEFVFCESLSDARWLEGVIKFVLVNRQSKPGYSTEWFVTGGVAALVRECLEDGDVDALRSLLSKELDRIAVDGMPDGISAVN